MRIKSFQIDGFGIYQNTLVDDLTSGINIFLGQNEAGKSTCLEFLRAMLTGFPDPRSKDAKRRTSRPGNASAGGSLLLDGLGNLSDSILLTRRPGSGGGTISLRDTHGQALEADLLRQAFAGISREVYRAVFAFSLSELESFASLSAEGVRNALYGASFGPGIASPGEVLKILARQAEDIFKPGGSRPPLNQAIHQLEEIRAKIAASAEESAAYDKLAANYEQERAKLAETRAQKATLEDERRGLERRIGVWKQWQEWRMNSERLAQLTDVRGDFPEDAKARLARIEEARDALARQVVAREEKISALKERSEAIALDPVLLARRDELRRLAERKSSYRRALTQIPLLEQNCLRLENELASTLAQLGPDWNCLRIRQTDRSLFAREDMERQAREMSAASSSEQAAIEALKRLERSIGTSRQAINSAKDALELLPKPEASLDEEDRDELRQTMARLEEKKLQQSSKSKAIVSARTAFDRSLEQLHLLSETSATTEELAQIEDLFATILRHQDEALNLSHEIEGAISQAADLAQRLSKAENEVENLRRQIGELHEAQRATRSQSREILDARVAALRSLRGLSANLDSERERLADLDSRINAHRIPAPVKSLPLIFIGLLLLMCGGSMLFAHIYLGLYEFALADNLKLPLNLWSGYLVLAAGVGFLAGGLPRNGPEIKQHHQELEQLQGRRESCALRLAELGEQARKLCNIVGLESLDSISLEATEVLLDREREQCFNEERSRAELAKLNTELAEAQAIASGLRGEAQEQEYLVQNMRRRWHSLLQSLHVPIIPSPESAATFFARIEAASAAHKSFAESLKESTALEQEIDKLEASIQRHLGMEELDSAACGEDLIAQARQLLTSCREADIARENRIRAEASLANHEQELEQLLSQHIEDSATLKSMQERKAHARQAWGTCLASFGFSVELDPQTVRQAFELMEKALGLESRLENTRAEQVQENAELDALCKPLGQIISEITQEAAPPINSDWLEQLDVLLAQSEEMLQAKNERKRLENQITEENTELLAAHASLKKAIDMENELLAQAKAKDADDFLRLASEHTLYKELSQRKKDLELALQLAAGTEELQVFLESFEKTDRESEDRRLAEIDFLLEKAQEDEQRLASQCASLDSRIRKIAEGNELAQLRQEESSLCADIERLALEWSRSTLACAILSKAKGNFERERQPEVIRQASAIFSQISNGRWRGITASLEDSSLLVLPAHGEAISPEELSRGAQEQVYLALRLAYIRNHAKHAEALPVIMDEILVNFDPERAERTARVLANIAEGIDGKRQQIIFFTCQPFMANLLHAACPDAALFHIQEGRISRA